MNKKGITSFREVFLTFALIGLFVFGILSFGIKIQQDNEVSDTILNNSQINSSFEKLQTNLSSISDQTQEQRENFESEIPERGFGSLLIFSIVSVGQRFTAIIIAVYNVLIVLPATILGISPIVTGVLGSILIVSLILLVWRVYRVGS